MREWRRLRLQKAFPVCGFCRAGRNMLRRYSEKKRGDFGPFLALYWRSQ